MEAIVVPIIVALITGPLVVFINRLRRENTSQHAESRSLLQQVVYKVDKVGTKLDEHIDHTGFFAVC